MKKIFIFSIFNWQSNLMHREHQLALAFKELGYEVTFVERKYWSINGLFKRKKEEQGINIITLLAFPYLRGRFKAIFRLNDWLLGRQIDFLENDTVVIVSGPLWGRVVQKGKMVYDMSDDAIAFAKNAKWAKTLTEYENALLKKVDLVVATSKNLLTKVPKGKNAIIVANGVDLKSFAGAKPILNDVYKGKIIGFVGGIFEWVDLELIGASAKELPSVDFVIIGPTNQSKKIAEISARYPNVHYLGPKPWQEIGNYFSSFDVGIVPFVSEEKYPRLKTVNSNKLFQYAYFGYPIVTTVFDQVKDLDSILYLSKDKKEFLDNLKKALVENDPVKSNKRKDFAERHSWEHQAKDILDSVLK